MGVSRYQVATLNVTISMWPANMFANNRTVRVKGRRMTLEKNSSTTISGTSGLGSPSSQTRFLTQPRKPCVLERQVHVGDVDHRQSEPGNAMREVAGNCASGMTSIRFIVQTRKNIVTRKRDVLVALLADHSRAIWSRTKR